jgi:RNA polymerase sigma-70 factor (ECF subfamily)
MKLAEQEQLFCQWLTAHRGLLWRVVRAFASDAPDQEDLFQEILLQLWCSVPTFRGNSKESTWIYRLAFNTALVLQRGEKRRRLKHEAFTLHAVGASEETASSGRSEQEVRLECLYSAIRELPRLDASLALMLLDGLSYRQMGEVLGISENHVGVRLHRIRKQLTERLKGQADEF